MFSTIDNIIYCSMDNTLTAQELKTRGAELLKQKTKKFKEAIITVRGEKRFVVLTIEQYNYFRECELEAALQEAEADVVKGKFNIESVEQHLKKLKNV